MAGSPTQVHSLRALEVFTHVARTGSLQETARALGMSAPAASQQLGKLEAALGHALIDHRRRPLELTHAGETYLVHAREALRQLRQGAIALSLMDLTRLRRLRLGVIDDFDSEVTPRLAVALAGVLTRCELSLLSAPSHSILDGLAAGRFDFGVAARPPKLPERVTEAPLLRDPFVLAVPRGLLPGPPGSLAAMGSLPFLRYDDDQLIGRQIAAELAWRKLSVPGRIALDSNQVLFGLVAGGEGWAITTALGFLRARRFQTRVDIHPLPFTGFSRVISLFRLDDWRDDVPGIIASTLREGLREQVVGPGVGMLPWLSGALSIPAE